MHKMKYIDLLETHPWLWPLLKGEFSCRSAELHLVTNLNTILINASKISLCRNRFSSNQKIAIMFTHLNLVMEKLRDKATVFTFHRDAVLQGLAFVQIYDNFFPTGEKVGVTRLRTYNDIKTRRLG